ncbi:MAG: MFS transporter [Acidobacteria bacterium]|nr:MFS transporter [Acidobacteriota bacterium]
MGRADSWGINRTVIALSVARLGDAVGNSILFIALPLYVAKLPAPLIRIEETVRVGLLLSLYGLVAAVLQSFAGAWSDRLGRRKPMIVAGLAVMCVGTIGFLFATRFIDLLLLRMLQGFGVALTIPASMALMAVATRRETRGSSMGIYSTMRMVGFAGGPLISGFLLVTFGFPSVFVAGAAFVLLGLIIVSLWVKEPPAIENAGPAGRFLIFDPKLISPGIFGAGLATFLMASSFSMMTTLEHQFNERLDQTALGFSVAFSALMVSRLLFQVPLGRLSDRIGRKPLLVGGLVLMGPATALLGLVTSTVQLTGVRLVQGLAAGAIAAPAFAVAADLSSSGGEGRQMSVVTIGFGLGLALGPLIAGVLAMHSFEMPFMIGGLMCVFGAWVVFRSVPETVRRNMTD